MIWKQVVQITVYPKKYAHGFCFAVLCCGYTLTDFPTSIRLTSLALWQSNDCPSASKATLMNMDKYFRCIHYERLHNHNKAKHNKTVCIFLGIYCRWYGGSDSRLIHFWKYRFLHNPSCIDITIIRHHAAICTHASCIIRCRKTNVYTVGSFSKWTLPTFITNW